jgi:hypothetical protein
VEGAAEHDCGPDQPKEGPLGSLVKHLASVTGEEPAHRNYDRDQRQTVQTETQGWRQGEEIADLSKAKEEDRWVLDPSPDKGRRCAQRVDNWLRCRATKFHTHAEDRRIQYQLLQPLPRLVAGDVSTNNKYGTITSARQTPQPWREFYCSILGCSIRYRGAALMCSLTITNHWGPNVIVSNENVNARAVNRIRLLHWLASITLCHPP